MRNTINTISSESMLNSNAQKGGQSATAERHAMRGHHGKKGLWMAVAAMVLGAGSASAQSSLNLGSIQSGSTASFSVQVSEQTFDIFGEVHEATPNDVLSATIDNKGNYSIPQSQLVIDPIQTDDGVTVQPTLTGPISGIINPSTGEWTMKMTLNYYLSGSGLPNGCYIGPVNWNMSSLDSNGGVKYSTSTGAAVLVDDSFTIPVASSTVCGNLASQINNRKDLPTASGENAVSFSVAANPIIVGSACVANATEVESTSTQSLGCAPSTIAGKIASTSDHDAYSFSGVASGKKVYVEHVATYTYKFQEDCVNAEDVITKTYSGPLVKLNSSTSYTVSTQTSQGGKYCDMGGSGATSTTVTTYKMKREVTPSNGVYTINVDPNTVTNSAFPVTGNYSLTVSIQ